MLNNTIEFACHPEYIKREKDVYPIPASFNIPEWFKKLKHKATQRTVKGCLPFLDTLTAGYILKLPQDLHLRSNFKMERINEKGEKEIIQNAYGQRAALSHSVPTNEININLRGEESQERSQLEGSPLLEKNNNMPKVMKIVNPWHIKTPPGYSCLFVSPLNNDKNDKFHIIAGIVDTDTYGLEINFPYIVNGDKYKTLNEIIHKGTPYVQVIPFKRENWKMKIKSRNIKEKFWTDFLLNTRFLHNYKLKYWNKKTWK
jgi:hypothetical protein